MQVSIWLPLQREEGISQTFEKQPPSDSAVIAVVKTER
jgi:hypothetical protein